MSDESSLGSAAAAAAVAVAVTAPPILRVSGLCKVYRTEAEDLPILDGLDLEAERGSTLSITGESGSGKSTLLNIIGGLEAPSGGRVEACGYELSGLDEAGLTQYRSRALGFVFQFHFLLKDFTALENAMLPGYMAGMRKAAALARARELLDAVGLGDRAAHYPSQLSGGERQRVAVARALMNDPELLLADEPTGNLDEKNSRVVSELLFSLVRDYGKTLVLVTHDPALADRTDRGYRLHAGRLESR